MAGLGRARSEGHSVQDGEDWDGMLCARGDGLLSARFDGPKGNLSVIPAALSRSRGALSPAGP